MIKFLIVDDEPIAHRIIEKFCEEWDDLELVGNCDDAFEAVSLLNKNRVDLMFLDINMPHMKGLDLLKSLTDPPAVVITTAFQEYAVEGFDLNVCDYLLKPFSRERFVDAVAKVRQKLKQKRIKTRAVGGSPSPKDYIFIRANKKLHKLPFDQLKYVESFRTHIVVHLENAELTVNRKITDFATLLPSDQFIRVHRSFIIALDKIDTISGNHIHLSGRKIPLGKVYKANLLDRFN